MSAITEFERRLDIPGRVTFEEGRGGLDKIHVKTEWSDADIYLHGAHVTHYQKKNEAPLLFLSEQSQFTDNQPIRGGVPVIFPWFGPREGDTMHGFARLKAWDLESVALTADGKVRVQLTFPECPQRSKFPPFKLGFSVVVGKSLEMALDVENLSGDRSFELETCLHTYFSVGDISAVAISGLKGRTYVDKVDNFVKKVEADEVIRVSSEVNRIYEDTSGPIEILDTALNRKIRIETKGATSTVVWNPWIARAREMTDFGDEEYLKMVCVESGNVAKNKISIEPKGATRLAVMFTT